MTHYATTEHMEIERLRRELAEARAALAEIDQHLTDLVLGERGWWGFWRDVHAAALKAAREQP